MCSVVQRNVYVFVFFFLSRKIKGIGIAAQMLKNKQNNKRKSYTLLPGSIAKVWNKQISLQKLLLSFLSNRHLIQKGRYYKETRAKEVKEKEYEN